METFTIPRELVHNPRYGDQRNKMLAGLSNDMIDDPIIDIVNGFNRLPCFCIDNNDAGKDLLKSLQETTFINPEDVQLCSADWFWERQVNTYALQVMPDRFKTRDSALLDYAEALHIEKTRNAFFTRLREMLQQP